MKRIELTKIEALKLISPVADDEASEKEREAFFRYIAHSDGVRKKYESVCALKSLINNRCPRAEAPESLRKKVEDFIRSSGDSDQQNKPEAPIYDIPTGGPAQNFKREQQSRLLENSYKYWLFSSAACLLLVIFSWKFFNFLHQPHNLTAYKVEDHAYEHFVENRGKFIKPTISTPDLISAELRLARTII